MKYFAMALGVILLGEAVLFLLFKPTALPVSLASSETGPEARELKSLEARVKNLHTLLAAVDDMRFASSDQTGEPIVAWRDVPSQPDQEMDAKHAGKGESALPPERKLTLIFTSGQDRSAMINGTYVRVGDRLPDGAKVVAIRPEAVVLVDAYGRHVLSPPPRQLEIGVVR